MTRSWSLTAGLVACAVACALLQLFVVRPFVAPAGHGASVSGGSAALDAASSHVRAARPPEPRQLGDGLVASKVPAASAAAQGGLRRGDRIVHASNLLNGRVLDASRPPADAVDAIRRWREAYRLGTRGPLELRVVRNGTAHVLRIQRPAAWSLPMRQWLDALAVNAGALLAMTMVVGAAIVLLLLRPRDTSALLIVLTLAAAGTSSGGSLLGSELMLPPVLSAPLTLFSWLALPTAFPLIALAVLYFPRKSDLLVRHPWLHAVPIAAALPMIVPAAGTALFLAGADRFAGLAAWDASHPGVFYASFAVGLLLNIGAMVEGVWRYRRNPDRRQRRRLAFVTGTLVLATLAFTIKDGIPALLALAGRPVECPWWFTLPLHFLIGLAGVGITYAVAVHRVLAPRVAVRASLRYALARKTLGLAGALPATLLIVALVEQRDRSLADIVSGQPLFYALLLAAVIAVFKYRDRARAWLDRRFFRQEYDARAILLSLAARIPYESDPNELTALVVDAIDAALHPTMVAVLVAGVEPGTLVPVSVLHGTADTLPERGGIGTMLTWSDTPLALDLGDERTTASRLPPDEIEWLRCTGATLFVPLSSGTGATRQLLGALVLGGRRSDEPYTADDRALLASIASQVSLGLDVARLRRQQSLSLSDTLMTSLPTGAAAGPGAMESWLVAECPQCGACYESEATACATDGVTLRRGRLPRVVDGKYRVERLLGRGGMGAVYRAHDTRLERDVAIKVVRSELLGNPDARTRFRREAQVVARLQHPGIVSIFDYGTLADGAAFLVMEYVRGEDLRSLLRRTGPFAPSRVASVITAIARPVDAAHRLGVLHRDLKPDNVLVPEDGETPGEAMQVKVLDFGVAKLLDRDGVTAEGDTLTLSGQPIGTPAYMAPEQLAGRDVSVRTDVFALAAIAYELLTGQPPFGRGPLVDVAERQRSGRPPLSVPGLATFGEVIGGALSPDPAQRPASAQAFADMLARTCTGSLTPDIGS